jgi:hypothetical protein
MPRRLGRLAVVALCATAWWFASCRDIAAPEGGVFAISRVMLPSPGLVVGDTMRDSTGIAAPLRLVAYDVDGKPITPDPAVVYTTLDTLSQANGAWLIGKAAGTSRVVGTTSGLQSKTDTVYVTLAPDTLIAADSSVHHVKYSLLKGDTSIAIAELAARVVHLPTTGVQAVIVRYKVERAPNAKSNAGSTVLFSNGNAATARDTTDAAGRSGVAARIRILALANSGQGDTAIFSATASYRGRTLGKVQFFVIFTTQ